MTRRLFLAVNFEPEKDFLNFYKGLKSNLLDERIKWVDENNLHITLKFLGETSVNILDIKLLMINVVKTFNPFDIQITGLGYFGSKNKPRIIFSELKNILKLKELSEALNNEFVNLSFEKEQNKYKPHLTLGRIKYLKNNKLFFSKLEKHSESFFQNVRISEIILYESILTSKGPEYIPLEKIKL